MTTVVAFLRKSVFIGACCCALQAPAAFGTDFSLLSHVLTLVSVISAHLKRWEEASHFVCVTHIGDIPLLFNIINCNTIEQLRCLKCQ